MCFSLRCKYCFSKWNGRSYKLLCWMRYDSTGRDDLGISSDTLNPSLKECLGRFIVWLGLCRLVSLMTNLDLLKNLLLH